MTTTIFIFGCLIVPTPFDMYTRVRLDTAENWKLKLKTEKHCSKIIFKCVNSIVGPIFNEKVAEKWNLWVREQYTMCCDWFKKNLKSQSLRLLFIEQCMNSSRNNQNAPKRVKKKKKRKRRIGQKTPNPNAL